MVSETNDPSFLDPSLKVDTLTDFNWGFATKYCHIILKIEVVEFASLFTPPVQFWPS